jgi:hypothetical protein
MEKAIAFTTLFVSQMLTRHEKMICYIPGKCSSSLPCAMMRVEPVVALTRQ